MPCTTITIAEPAIPLSIESVDVKLDPTNDSPLSGKFGVLLTVVITGDGSGAMNIQWGNEFSERKYNLMAGNFYFAVTMPPGTHEVCAVME